MYILYHGAETTSAAHRTHMWFHYYSSFQMYGFQIAIKIDEIRFAAKANIATIKGMHRMIATIVKALPNFSYPLSSALVDAHIANAPKSIVTNPVLNRGLIHHHIIRRTLFSSYGHSCCIR